jgi:hypothetical protein
MLPPNPLPTGRQGPLPSSRPLCTRKRNEGDRATRVRETASATYCSHEEESSSARGSEARPAHNAEREGGANQIEDGDISGLRAAPEAQFWRSPSAQFMANGMMRKRALEAGAKEEEIKEVCGADDVVSAYVALLLRYESAVDAPGPDSGDALSAELGPMKASQRPKRALEEGARDGSKKARAESPADAARGTSSALNASDLFSPPTSPPVQQDDASDSPQLCLAVSTEGDSSRFERELVDEELARTVQAVPPMVDGENDIAAASKALS